MSPIQSIVLNTFQLFNLLMIVWCLLSWFPNINWYNQPFKTLDMIIRPVIAPFRKIIPPIANMDVSPVVALLVLQGLCNLIVPMLP
jgi:YggT family protein